MLISRNITHSMNNRLNELSLQSNTSDYVALAAKGALGTVPFVGSLLAELAGTVIPEQRIDRIVKFAQALEKKLLNLEEEFIRSQITNEQFTDLIEESLRQSARSLTDDRRNYIAAVVANSLSFRDIEYIESKHLLRILGEINDIEVIWLRRHANTFMKGDDEFREKHKNVLEIAVTTFVSSPEEVKKKVLQESYKEHLVQLGLLKRRYKVDTKTKALKYDTSTNTPQISGYVITPLGKLLLQQIDLEPDANSPIR